MDEELMFRILTLGMPLVIGGLFLIIGMVTYQSEKKKQITWTVNVLGKVKDMASYSDREGGLTCHPIFEYVAGNETIVTESQYGTSRPRYEVGQEIEIYYNPEKVEEYYIKGETLPKRFAIIFSVVGALVMIMGIISSVIISY